MPGQYFLVFFTLPAWRNSFQGALPPTVGQSFLLTSSSLPKADGLASVAIWANCWVGNDDSNLPTSSSHLASSTCVSASSIFFSSSLTGEGFLAGDGWCTGEGSSVFSLPGSEHPPLPTPLILFWCHFHPGHAIKQIGKHQPIEKQHDFVLMRFCQVAILNS